MALRILIVDDSLTMRRLLLRTLSQAGFPDAEILEAGTGAEGLERFDPRSIDLVLTDVNMPEMDGFALAREVRKRSREVPDGKPVRILMMTADGEPAMLQAARDAGADGLLVKPFTPPALVQKIKDMLGA